MVIGITGGIGSGKSMVCRTLNEDHGIQVYYTDDRAKYLMRNDPNLKKLVISEFGYESYVNDELNRKYLADIIFNNKEKLEIMNSFVRPTIESDFIKWMSDKTNESYILYESAILNTNKPDYIDKICYISASEEIRIQRVKSRDSMNIKDIKSRMDSQSNFSEIEIKQKFDYMIKNDSNNKDELKKSVADFNQNVIKDIKSLKRSGRYLSLLLRHNPGKEDLSMDMNGWVSCSELYKKLKLSKSDLEFIVRTNNKGRFAFNDKGTSIRANQGHSLDWVDVELEQDTPPENLYHGTSPEFLKSIYEDGLSRMTRNHIHFSHDLETAINVGSRKDKKPIILHVSALEMHNDGIKFYKSKNGVWLTGHIPSKYIKH